MEDENIPVNTVENDSAVVENDEHSKVISDDLKELIQFLKENKIESDQIAEAEKQIQIEAENQQKELDEQEKIETIKQQEKDLKEEQLLLESENEFRTNLIDSLSLQNEKMDTYIQKSDGLSESIESLNETTAILVQNTDLSEKEQANQDITYYSGLAILVVVMIFIPAFIMFKFLQWVFNLILKNII